MEGSETSIWFVVIQDESSKIGMCTKVRYLIRQDVWLFIEKWLPEAVEITAVIVIQSNTILHYMRYIPDLPKY